MLSLALSIKACLSSLDSDLKRFAATTAISSDGTFGLSFSNVSLFSSSHTPNAVGTFSFFFLELDGVRVVWVVLFLFRFFGMSSDFCFSLGIGFRSSKTLLPRLRIGVELLVSLACE